jgi:hypothetical protein
MTDLKQLAQNLRNYNAWRRGDGKNANIEMPHPIDLGTWIDSAIAVVEAHAKSNVLAQRAEKLEADRDALAGISKELIERLREAAAQRVASTAMIGADDLIAAADALEIATAGMNAYCDELGSCRKAAGFGSADDPMAQEGVGAFSDPLCVAAFVESQFKRIVAERDALAAELKALREQEPVVFIEESELEGITGDVFIAYVCGIQKEFWRKPLYALPVPTREMTDAVDDLAQHIRQIDGNNSMGAGALAESIAEWADRYLKGEGNDHTRH